MAEGQYGGEDPDYGNPQPPDDWFSRNPPPAAPGFDEDAIRAAYRQYLGRDATVAEISAHRGNPGGTTGVIDLIKASEEAKAYAANKPPAPTTGGAPTVSSANGPIRPQLEAFFRSRGVPLTEVPYWESKWAELEARGKELNQPGYANMRLGMAEILGGPKYGAAGGPSGAAPNATSAQFSGPPAPYLSTPFAGGPYTPPALPANLQTPFAPPTQAQIEASPGYATRLAAGVQARERAGASRGTIFSGGFQKAMERYAQDYAANEGANLYGQLLGARGQNYGEYTGSVNVGNQTYANRYNAWAGENSRTLTDFLTNLGARRNYESDVWGRLNDLYQGGLRANL